MRIASYHLRKPVALLPALRLAIWFALAVSLGFSGMQNAAFAQQSPPLPTPADLSRAFIEVAKRVKPAVVSIDTVEKARQTPEEQLLFGDPRPRRGTGSGVIISPDGYILTNNHVAGGAEKIKVKLADDREFPAKRIGTDAETDLAIIKIEAQNLPFAKLGDSDRLEQGEWVIALGSPFGFQQTMTAGIVSATGRDLSGRIPGAQFTNYIQTDASINPGNSGGPLINMQGEIIGINTLIFSQTGASSGIGFSIPSNLANKVRGQLIQNGRVIRGYLGVQHQDLTPAMAKKLGYAGDSGALVNDIPDSAAPAGKAGLQSGDIIVEIDGKPVKSARNLTEYVADLKVGQTIKVKYVRDGRAANTTITLAERPPVQVAEAEPAEERMEDPSSTQLGLRVQTLTPEMAARFRLKSLAGAIVQQVKPGSPAAEAQLLPGDVILKIDNAPIASRQDFLNALTAIKAGDDSLLLQIERRGRLSFVEVSLER